jgi:hypothetical protein
MEHCHRGTLQFGAVPILQGFIEWGPAVKVEAKPVKFVLLVFQLFPPTKLGFIIGTLQMVALKTIRT